MTRSLHDIMNNKESYKINIFTPRKLLSIIYLIHLSNNQMSPSYNIYIIRAKKPSLFKIFLMKKLFYRKAPYQRHKPTARNRKTQMNFTFSPCRKENPYHIEFPIRLSHSLSFLYFPHFAMHFFRNIKIYKYWKIKIWLLNECFQIRIINYCQIKM